MAGGIFVSYRRDDTRQAAGRLADDLADAFGASRIFRDIEAIELGVDFTAALNQALESCVVMLVLIGGGWLGIKSARGERRLDDPHDWIRLEIATALKRGIRVVPVLVDGAELPAEDALPAELRPLVGRQALDLADGRWRGDLQRLVAALSRLPGLERDEPHPSPLPPAPAPAPGPTPAPVPVKAGKGKLWAGIGVGVVGLLVLAGIFGEGDKAQPGPIIEPVLPAAMPVAQPTRVPAPVTRPAPVEAPAPVIPNLAGMWRTNSGETYQFQQRGNQLQFVAFAQGQNVGGGNGELEGALLRLSMTMSVQGVPLGNLNCNMQAAPDFRAFSGICQGPNGQFPAQFFR